VPPNVLSAWLAEQTTRIQKLRAALEQEHATLEAEIASVFDYTPGEVADIAAFCAELRGRMHNATREQIAATLRELHFSAVVMIDDKQKVAYAECVFAKDRFSIVNKASCRLGN
jgi:hypothetical protein